jgi:rubrerythrin
MLPEDGYVAIHDSSLLDGAVLDSVIGVSEYLEAGTYEDLNVHLFDVRGADFDAETLEEDQTLIAMPHKETSGNETYDFVASGGEEDGPFTEDGEAVVDDGMVTVVEEMDDEDMEEVSDLDVLNYALTLEHLEAAYYNQFLEEYSESEVERSEAARVFADPGSRFSTYQKIEEVRDHEEAHVEALEATIEELGGDPVEPAEYEFPYDSIEAFVSLSATIEAVGVSAYAGAAPLIESDAVLEAALSIHSVEARHTAYFNVLNTTSPFPNAFDEPRTMEEVLEIASQFIVSDE